VQPDRSSSRITEVDALRGFALFGLFVVHMVEYFELFWYAPEWGPVHDAVFFMFGGKAYAIFALLFGFSFSLMMGRQARRGVDFRGRFAWRLVLLLAMGYLHGLLYSGDILQVLALAGLVLIALYPLGNRSLLVVAALGLLQAPKLIQLGLALVTGVGIPEAHHPELMGQTFAIYANGSFAEVVQRNVWAGQLGKWLFMLESGRLWNVIGMFCVGVVLERSRFFETFRQRVGRAAVAGLVLLALLPMVGVAERAVVAAGLPEDISGLAGGILEQYGNNLLTGLWILLFLAACYVPVLRAVTGWLAAPGRMSLTIYVSQSLYGVPLFYGFGLGLYTGFGQRNALALGLVLWGVQMVFAGWWLRRYHYGPLEWLWRSATWLSSGVPWKRHDRQRDAARNPT
jgi:uncharacterized protein